MKLNALKIKAGFKEAKESGKTRRLFDGKGLYIEIIPNGGARWRFRYQFESKDKLISLGLYPEISLADARELLMEKRKLVAKGINPSEKRKEEKIIETGADSFESIAKEWWEHTKVKWSDKHAKQNYRRLELNVFPYIGKQSIDTITPKDVLALLRRIEERGALEMTHRVKSVIGQVMRYGVATGRAERDVTADLRDALTPVKAKHHASITDPKEIGGLLRSIDSYQGHHITRCALKLSPLVFVRPGELRQAEWSEIDFETKEWRIPASKMKARRMHVVPLSKQVIAILEEIKPLTGRGKYVFPSSRSFQRPMSNNAITSALRRMGYSKDDMTAHGFRSMASTILNEQGYRWDAIERQLAHVEGNSVRAAYNYADYLPERTQMMQDWADYLDGLRED